MGDIWKLPLERDKTDRTDKENIIDIRNCLAFRATLAILLMVFLREDINRKKRFLSGIARMRGGGVLPRPEFFGPFSRSAFLVNKKSISSKMPMY